MKRIGNIFQDIISIENLELADENARKNKTRKEAIIEHDKHKEEDILLLHEMLKNKAFKNSPYTEFTIYEKKERKIAKLPYFPDRIVHHAIVQVLKNTWDSVLTNNTFSSIKGRGVLACSVYTDKLIRKYEGCPLYCLKIDVKKFYPSIDHGVLKWIIRKKIKDKDVLWLLDEIIDSKEGLPIGNYISSYFANLYLSYFIHYMKEVVKVDCCEYADDIVFLADNKEFLHKILHEEIMPYLKDKLKLEVKENYQVFPVAYDSSDKYGRPIDFVGYKAYRNHKLLRNDIRQTIIRKVRNLNKGNLTVKRYISELAPWIGWLKYSDSRELVRRIVPKHYLPHLEKILDRKKKR